MRQVKTIGVVSIASSCSSFPIRTQRAKQCLKDLGFEVVFSDHALDDFFYTTEKASNIATDIHSLFTRSDIDMILISTGGNNGNAFLEHLDFKVISKHWKPICGFSDATPLLLAIHTKTKKPVFHGPMMLPSFGEFGGVNKDSLESFQSIIIRSVEEYVVPTFDYYTDESLFWDREDTRLTKTKPADPLHVVREGVAEGSLVGGNIEGIIALLGTNFVPKFSGKILFLEDAGNKLSQLERKLFHLKQAGVFDEVAGVIFSKLSGDFDWEGASCYVLCKMLSDVCDNDIPIVYGYDCGHTRPLTTYPIGYKSALSATKDGVRLIFNKPEYV